MFYDNYDKLQILSVKIYLNRIANKYFLRILKKLKHACHH
jgi:hypothetical protein